MNMEIMSILMKCRSSNSDHEAMSITRFAIHAGFYSD